MSSRHNLGVRWPDYDEHKNKKPYAPIGRTHSGQYVIEDDGLLGTRYEEKKENKKALVQDVIQLETKDPILNGKRIGKDVGWPSTEKRYYQTSKEKERAVNAKEYEKSKDPQNVWKIENAMEDDEYAEWELKNVSKDGKKGMLCNLTTGQCIMIALAAGVGLSYLLGKGGASRKRLKSRVKKTRRPRKK
jgi:hypothetical protein